MSAVDAGVAAIEEITVSSVRSASRPSSPGGRLLLDDGTSAGRCMVDDRGGCVQGGDVNRNALPRVW